jgi:molybdopterin-guanine dinucleotide biosynthesis protein A
VSAVGTSDRSATGHEDPTASAAETAPTSGRSTRCTGAILAGGPATRFGGRPKGLEPVHGTRIIDRVADALRSASEEILLVANDPRAASWLAEVAVVADVRPGFGSLGGLLTALVHARTPVLVVAWDMPFVPGPLLRELRRVGETDGYDAVVPLSGSPRGVEPLCAYYTEACVSAIERRLDAGDRRMIGFFDDVRVGRLDSDVVRRFGDPERIFVNVNRPHDLDAAEDLTDGSGA